MFQRPLLLPWIEKIECTQLKIDMCLKRKTTPVNLPNAFHKEVKSNQVSSFFKNNYSSIYLAHVGMKWRFPRNIVQRITIQWHTIYDYIKCKYTTVWDECNNTINTQDSARQLDKTTEQCWVEKLLQQLPVNYSLSQQQKQMQ